MTRKSMERKPGDIAERPICKMRDYPGKRGVDVEELTPIVNTFFTSIYLPSVKSSISARNEQTMRLLSNVIDLIVGGELAVATDMLFMQYKLLEQLVEDKGNFRMAKHLDPAVGNRVSVMEDRERQHVLRDERAEINFEKLKQQVHHGKDGR